MASVIYVKKQDDLASIVEKIINSPEKEIVLVVPKNSFLAKSYFNFEILKREVENVGKKIFIDTLDPIIKNFAHQVQIEVITETQKEEILDILPPKKNKKTKEFLTQEKTFKDLEPLAKENFKKKEDYFEKINKIWKKDSSRLSLKTEIIKDSKNKRKKSLIFLALIILGASLSYLFFFKLPKVTLIIYPKKIQKVVEARLGCAPIETIDFENQILPAKILTFERIFEKKFSASGKKLITTKASGKVKIYNAYSSQPQILVKNTRLLGIKSKKLFRLPKKVVIEGAKVIKGKIVPSYIITEIIADKPGEEFNIGRDKFFFPAFKESHSPRYSKVWAETIEEIKGGESKKVTFITKEDLYQATSSLEKNLKFLLETELKEKTKNNFLLPQKNFNLKIEYTTSLKNLLNSQKEDFVLKGKASLETFAISKKDFLKFIEFALKKEVDFEKWQIEDFKEEFSEVKKEVAHPLISFKAVIKVSLLRKIDPNFLKQKIRNYQEKDLRNFLANLKEIEKAQVIFWPFWVKKVPRNLKKIIIKIKK